MLRQRQQQQQLQSRSSSSESHGSSSSSSSSSTQSRDELSRSLRSLQGELLALRQSTPFRHRQHRGPEHQQGCHDAAGGGRDSAVAAAAATSDASSSSSSSSSSAAADGASDTASDNLRTPEPLPRDVSLLRCTDSGYTTAAEDDRLLVGNVSDWPVSRPMERPTALSPSTFLPAR